MLFLASWFILLKLTKYFFFPKYADCFISYLSFICYLQDSFISFFIFLYLYGIKNFNKVGFSRAWKSSTSTLLNAFVYYMRLYLTILKCGKSWENFLVITSLQTHLHRAWLSKKCVHRLHFRKSSSPVQRFDLHPVYTFETQSEVCCRCSSNPTWWQNSESRKLTKEF